MNIEKLIGFYWKCDERNISQYISQYSEKISQYNTKRFPVSWHPYYLLHKMWETNMTFDQYK